MYMYMDCLEALELAKLRMKEDGISWTIAYKEFRQLTGLGLTASMHYGVTLLDYTDQLRKETS